MPKIAKKLDSQTGAMVEVRQRNDNQPPNSCFCYYCGCNIFKMKLEILIFRDRLGNLLKMRPSGVAELCKQEIPV